MLKIKNQTNETAELYISGDIVDDVEGGLIRYFQEGDTTGIEFPQKFREELKAVEDKTLTVFINSYGGNVFAGVALSNMLSRRKGKTICQVDGICASIATQIFFVADECKIPANCYLMIHRPEVELIGNAAELRKAADTLDTIQQGLETTYQQKAKEGVTAETITELVNAESWLTGQEAAKYFNIEVMEPVKVVNCIGSLDKLKKLKYKNIPSKLTFAENNQRQQQKIKIALARARGALIS